ncbi:MAG: RidA family protein [Candidatus Eisenbacteria bacterium]|uniref:RidA family protein n=1 Tax=Eiseniibacteriota bacterium TaxID=2212470 RepID=A0A538SJU4_UNCEI|nr:MAG: RidA family protein [Candidatus Eisenbacteria bacterium]
MKAAIEVSGAPRPVGPYSQAQVVSLPGGDKMVFTAGQVALDPATGKLRGGTVAEQTEQVLGNLEAVLAGAGLTFADVVKTTVFLTDMKDFQEMNQVYARSFPSNPPARSTFAAAGLPLGARVEIDAVAVGRGR